jgi:myo-inositol-1-phosphate synthase
VHIGPADYVPWQKDNKVCFLRMEGARVRGHSAETWSLRLSVEDSPNRRGVRSIDAIRLCRVARDQRHRRGDLVGVVDLMKHPPEQTSDSEARLAVEAFIAGKAKR